MSVCGYVGMYVCVCVCVCVTMMGYRDAGGSPRLGAPGPGLDHQDNHSGHAKKEVGVPVGKGLAMASGRPVDLSRFLI